MVRLIAGPPRTAVLAGLALSLLVVGCSSSGAGHEQDGPDVRPWSGAVHFSSDEATRLHEAVEQSVASCMRGRGFAYRPQPSTDQRRAAAANPYGLLTDAVSSQDGYGIVGVLLSESGEPSADGNTEVVAGLDGKQAEKWKDALLGRDEDRREVVVPDGPTFQYSPDSCAVRGREDVYGKGWDEARIIAEAASNGVIQAVGRDDAYAESVGAWSACMEEHGHTYPDLQAPRADLTSRAEKTGSAEALRKLGGEEIDIARQDHACERQVRLHEAAAEAQSRAEKAALRHDGELEEKLEQLRAMKRRAVTKTHAKTAG
ncbi:hypothetical protein [Streptomyces sp. NEAU-W12]|uniref:hypothetical protein n=1 Tax=Streptomyces sp. NEAU-W12 TaxID=2994668 RepID=UPI00224B42ED|nr:hypothetical protein [Streptomyces sp. NEAU-W12]MCX2927346.1 hypothetical protein [Streptomyces sp. NEAU-W12]